MSYTTKAKLDAYNGGNIDSTLFTSLLASVKAYIDRYCGKTFEAVAGVKTYDGNGSNELLVDSLVGNPTYIKILNSDGTTYLTLTQGQSNDYVLLPLNSTEKNVIRLTAQGAYSCFSKQKSLVEISASFGASAAVPADIELAATKLIDAMARQGAGDVKSEALGDYSVSYASIEEKANSMGVVSILDSYRDIDI